MKGKQEMAYIYFLVKAGITAGITVLFYIKIKKHYVIRLLPIVIIAIFLSVLADAVADIAPSVKDKVQVTALGEGDAEALGTDVFLRSYVVDKKEYDIENAVEGKWFWLDDVYGWRDKKDKRQPQGVTRQITVMVPVGYHREITFRTGDNRGFVQVTVRNETYTADTRTTGQMTIPGSRLRMILLNFLWRGFVFAAAELVFIIFVYFGIFICSKDALKKRYLFFYCSLCLAGIYLLTVIPSSTKQSFWLDEMYQIGYSGGSLTLLDSLLMNETTPPLYRVLVNIWYHIVPYGEGFLLLLSELLVAAAVVVIAFAGKAYRNAQTGIIAAVFMMTSVYVTKHCSYELRSYALLLLLSSICLWQFISRWKRNVHTAKEFAGQWLIMLLLCYTHYFGLFLCMSVFVFDLALLFSIYPFEKKCVQNGKICKRFWLMYFMLGISYIPWVFRVVAMEHLGTKGIGLRVTASTFYSILSDMLDSNWLRLLLCSVGFSILIVDVAVCWKKDIRTEKIADAIPVGVTCILFCGVAVYGIYINPGLTLWADRYFTPAFPWMAVVMAMAVDRIIIEVVRIRKIDIENNRMALCTVTFALLLYFGIPSVASWYGFMQNSYNGQDYRAAANWLYAYNEGDIYRDRVAVAYLRSATGNEGNGWYEYYLTKRGQRDAPNFISNGKLTYEEFEKFYESYDMVFLCTMPFPMDQCNREWITWIKERYELIETNDNYQICIFQKNAD